MDDFPLLPIIESYYPLLGRVVDDLTFLPIIESYYPLLGMVVKDRTLLPTLRMVVNDITLLSIIGNMGGRP